MLEQAVSSVHVSSKMLEKYDRFTEISAVTIRGIMLELHEHLQSEEKSLKQTPISNTLRKLTSNQLLSSYIINQWLETDKSYLGKEE